jgi:membrane protein DedA with SNARE-associated domain
METTTFSTLVTWVISHGYFLFYIATFLEGPLVTAAAGVAAALGYFSFPVIILISILGDLTADVVYYTIGYLGRKTIVPRFGPRIGLTKERIERIEKFLKRHAGKTMMAVKLSPLIPIPGLIVIGSAKVPIKKFVALSLLITLPKSLLFGLIGLLSGKAYERLSTTVTHGQLILFGVAIVVILVYVAYTKLAAKLSEKLDDNQKLL